MTTGACLTVYCIIVYVIFLSSKQQIILYCREVPAEGCISEYIDMAHCQEKPETHVEHMEHVLLYVDVDANRRGAVKITLTSPDGTISEMVSTRRGDNSKEGMHMRFLSLNNWGENIVGKKKWKIEICDTLNAESLNKVKFIRYI